MAKKQEEISKENTEAANKAIADQLNLVSQIQDKMAFILKTSKEKYTQDRLALDLTKQATNLTKSLSSEYTSLKDVEKDIARNKKLQNEVSRTMLNLEKEIGAEGKKKIEFIKNQEKGLEKSKKILEELRKNETLGIKGAKEQADALGKQILTRQKSLNTQKENLPIEEKEYALLKETSKILEGNVEHLQDQGKQQENLVKSQSVFTSALTGASNVLNKLGMGDLSKKMGLDAGAKKAKEMTYILTEGGKKSLGVFGKMKVAAASFGATLKSALGPLALISMLIGAIVNAYNKGKEAATRLSDENVELSRTMGVAQGTANGIAGAVRGIGASMGITGGQATASAGAIYSALDGAEKISTRTLATFVKLNVFAGMSADSIADIQKFSKLSGKDAGVVAEEMAKTAQHSIKANKVNISLRTVMMEVGKTSSILKINMGGSTSAITNAVIQSKKLGLELKQVEDIANSLLNIEDSIAAEMEAELLTGKDLNLEKAREAALNNDNVTLMEEISKNFGSIEEFGKMNRVQQEAFAKSIGMSRDGLADMLVKGKENVAANTALVGSQGSGTAAMESQAKLSETLLAQEEARANQFAGIFALLQPIVELFKDMGPLVLKLITPIVQVLAPILQNIMEDLLPVIAQLFDSIAPILQKLAELLAPIIEVVGKVLVTAVGFLAQLFERIVPFIVNILDAFMPIVDIIVKIVEDLMPVFLSLFDSVIPIVEEILAALLPIISEVLAIMAPILKESMVLFTDLLKQLLPPIKELLVSLAPVIGDILKALMPILKLFMEVQAAILPLIIDLFKMLVPVIVEILDAVMPIITALLGLIAPILKPILGIFVELAKMLLPLLVDNIKLLLPILKPILTIIGGIATLITGIIEGDFSKVADGLKGIAEGLINLVIKAFEFILNLPIRAINALLDYVPNFGPNTIPAVKFGTVKLAEGGIVDSPTNALIGEAGPEAVVPLNNDKSMNVYSTTLEAKLDKLIDLVSKGGDVFLDGNKVGVTLALSNYRQQ
jgi:phage-related protein